MPYRFVEDWFKVRHLAIELGPGALAKASGLIAIGYQMQEVYLKGFARNVNKAAELLESIGKLESAASCFCDLGDFKRAGMACRAYVKFDGGAQKVAKFSFANSSLQLRFFS
ncbi:hypothetical protein E3N88_13873 [Mikania micrantha]|uniref:Uncharacterized protein n=1 Tax=Mikania micrantha TaxID=192012 RepID=A0A5N6P1W0_9ASTR|nr:hypothetical protein E3N88_13873 [Mikania micrantha]